MLLGAARVRQGDADGGIAILAEAERRSAHAHHAIRSEIAFCLAVGFWAKRDIDTAEHYLALVDKRADIIHARALELQGWCQMARGNYRLCAEFFVLTLLRLDTCRAGDRTIVATAISTLSILGAELFDPEIARVAELRAAMMEWSPAQAVQQYLTLLHQALFHEFSGHTVKAYELAMQAREIAPEGAFEAYGWSVSSVIARNAGEACAALVCAQRAQAVLERLDLRELTGEERFSILAVAESVAQFDARTAGRLFGMYWGLTPADRAIALAADPRLAAEETLIAAMTAEAHGDVDEARDCYNRAFERFARIGYVRRAVVAAFALVTLDDDEAMRAYLTERLAGTTNYITKSLAGLSAN